MFGILRRGINSLSDKVMSTEILIKADLPDGKLKEAFRIAQKIEAELSVYRENSYISRINRYAGLSSVKCPPHVVGLIKEAVRMAEITGGLFDPTVGVIVHRLFGFGRKERIPSAEEIERVRHLVDYRKVNISGDEVFLEEEGMFLDLGGIAKGWASQRLAEFLLDAGATKVLVSIGGEICTFGRRWKIGVKDPAGEENVAIIETTEDETTITTSGSYERFIGKEENHHIFNPLKGFQENLWTSLTLVERGFKGAELDALATACFCLPSEELKEFSKSYLAIDRDGDRFIGSALRDKVGAILLI